MLVHQIHEGGVPPHIVRFFCLLHLAVHVDGVPLIVVQRVQRHAVLLVKSQASEVLKGGRLYINVSYSDLNQFCQTLYQNIASNYREEIVFPVPNYIQIFVYFISI